MIRYAGVYYGPSYGNPFAPSYEGFTSISQATERYRERQETSGRYPLDVTELTVVNGEVTAVEETASLWPSTSPQDTLEVYAMTHSAGELPRIGSEPVFRLTTSPRGNMRRENY